MIPSFGKYQIIDNGTIVGIVKVIKAEDRHVLKAICDEEEKCWRSLRLAIDWLSANHKPAQELTTPSN